MKSAREVLIVLREITNYLLYLCLLMFTYCTYATYVTYAHLYHLLMQSLIGMTQHLVILMTRISMTLPILEKSWREAEEKSQMKPVLITCHIQFMYLTYHTYNHLLYLQIMDHQCLHYDLTLKLHLIWKSLCICPQVMTWIK